MSCHTSSGILGFGLVVGLSRLCDARWCVRFAVARLPLSCPFPPLGLRKCFRGTDRNASRASVIAVWLAAQEAIWYRCKIGLTRSVKSASVSRGILRNVLRGTDSEEVQLSAGCGGRFGVCFSVPIFVQLFFASWAFAPARPA
eukprot:Lithocolla_globosa_v1_NODE_641_length_3531_cov_128.763809.p6 type:complete len:143 gc:universal NODE_641_length_3531_cov_128.763809:2490-2918(+)